MPPLQEEEASIDSPGGGEPAISVLNSRAKRLPKKQTTSDVKDPRFRRKMMEMREFVAKERAGEPPLSKQKPAKGALLVPSSRKETSLNRVQLGGGGAPPPLALLKLPGSLQNAGVAILEKNEKVGGAGDKSSIAAKSLIATSTAAPSSSVPAGSKVKSMKGGSQSMIMELPSSRKGGVLPHPHQTSISCL